jgi:hypothetical protein
MYVILENIYYEISVWKAVWNNRERKNKTVPVADEGSNERNIVC